MPSNRGRDTTEGGGDEASSAVRGDGVGCARSIAGGWCRRRVCEPASIRPVTRTPTTASGSSAGVDLNELFGVPEQFHHFLSCTEDLSAGEHWRPFVTWIAGDGVDSVYPPGYVPLRPQPIDDFVAKLTVKVVTDGGTPKQKTYVFSPAAAVRTDITLDQLEPDAPPLGLAVTMPRMKPLSVGEHTYEVTWVLSAQHCDGLGAVVEENCLPAGELPIDGGPLTVTTPVH